MNTIKPDERIPIWFSLFLLSFAYFATAINVNEQIDVLYAGFT